MTTKTKILIGVLVLLVIAGGLFLLKEKFYPVTKIDCVLGKETKKEDIRCQILEIKNRGSVLKVSEMIFPPERKEVEDIITTNKFVEVKVRLKTEKEYRGGMKRILSQKILIDNQGQEYEEFLHENIDYWLLPLSQGAQWYIIPGEENEYNLFFEVPKDIENFKKLRLIFSEVMVY